MYLEALVLGKVMPLEKQSKRMRNLPGVCRGIGLSGNWMPWRPVGEKLTTWEDKSDGAAMKPSAGRIPIK